jgi:hypothetical protein
MDSQCVRYEQQVRQLHLGTGLHALNGRPVDAALLGEGLLGEVLAQSPDADAVAGGPASVGDPLGLFGWHGLNRLPTMIISQQQDCGII